MGSFVGIQKIAAKRIGISYEEYLIKIVNHKWCSACKQWKPRECFCKDKNRGDGIATKCYDCTRVKVKKCWKGRVSTFKDHKHSEDSLDKMRKSHRARMDDVDFKHPMKGRHHSIESRIKISQTKRKTPSDKARGKNHHSYKDGKVSERRGMRFSAEYKRWRYDVFVRDNFTCQECGDDRGGNLNAHHKKSFADYPDLRFDVDNGVTLCEDCHNKKHRSKNK